MKRNKPGDVCSYKTANKTHPLALATLLMASARFVVVTLKGETACETRAIANCTVHIRDVSWARAEN